MFTREVDDELSLALVQPSFAKDYLRIIAPNQADFATFLPWASAKLSEDFFLGYVNRSLHSYADGQTLPCAIVYQGRLVGNIDLHQIDYSLSKAKIGYWLDPDFRGRGIVTKSCQKMIEIGFNEMALTKIEIWAITENTDSCAVAERLGFTQEAIITQGIVVADKIYDKVGYGLQQ